ncbi:MAG: alpha/beta hydrolase [Clostridiales bacterium]|nr:alpha/beta hydrolase [Clostridiales bacterium]
MLNQNVFKTPQSRDQIRSRYNGILSTFPFGQRYLDTSYGRTFVLEAGAPESPALVLLHGSCSNSAFWYPELCALSGSFRVLAVDILGEAGNSDENRLGLASEGYADWLKEVLDALSVSGAVLVGNSLGGWMAMKFAVKYPQFVSKLILVATAGLSRLNPDFLDRANKAASQDETMKVDAGVTGEAALPQEVEEFINLILWGYNPVKEELPVFSDHQLAKLTMPLLYVAGKDDAMIDTVAAAQRLKKQLPNAHVHLLENTGHMVLSALEHIIPFLSGEE